MLKLIIYITVKKKNVQKNHWIMLEMLELKA